MNITNIIIIVLTSFLVYKVITILFSKVYECREWRTNSKKILFGMLNLLKLSNKATCYLRTKVKDGSVPPNDVEYYTRYSIETDRFSASLKLFDRQLGIPLDRNETEQDFISFINILSDDIMFDHYPKMELYIDIKGTNLSTIITCNHCIHKFLNGISYYHNKGVTFDEIISKKRNEYNEKDRIKTKKGEAFLNKITLPKDY